MKDFTAPKLIIRFKTRTERDFFYQKRFSLKNVTIGDLGLQATKDTEKMYNKIFINESHCIYTKELYKYCRFACKQKKYEYCAIENGIVCIRQQKDTNKIRVQNEQDAKRIFGDGNVT